MAGSFIKKASFFLLLLLLFPLAAGAVEEDKPLLDSVAGGAVVAIAQATPLTPTPITIPITVMPTLTATVNATPTPEPPGTAKPDHPEREAALATLEQLGAPTVAQSAGDISSSRTPTVTDLPTSTILELPILSPTPSLLNTNSEAVPALSPPLELTEVATSQDVFTQSRPAADARRDGIVLLIVSGALLVALYVSMSRNLKSRDFSKYRHMLR
jgi:hypothetical protein